MIPDPSDCTRVPNGGPSQPPLCAYSYTQLYMTKWRTRGLREGIRPWRRGHRGGSTYRV